MFNNSSHIDASHSTFSEVHRDQYYNVNSTVQGNQTVNTIIHGNQIYQDSHSNLLEGLQKASAPSAAFNSAERYPAPKCIEGTRVELLGRLTSWIDEPNQKPICWLNGRPGSGKSAISQTIADMYASQKRLAASFFFSRRDLERRTTRHVVPTLTMQLLSFFPSIRTAVFAALENDYMLPMKVLREQMDKLLLGPIATAILTSEAPILIVIDALDECDEENLVSELVALLALVPQRISFPLRLLITSRSEPWIQSRFHQPDISEFTLSLDIHAFSAEADIRSFLERALDDTYENHSQVMKDVPRPWPSLDQLDHIVNKAGGLFVFALTVVKFVGDKTHNPNERLKAILGDKNDITTGSAYAELDSLYRDAISVFPDSDVARLVLGLVYCMAIPLSISGLHRLLQRPDVDARLVVPALSSVLLASEDGKQPIQFYHASFRDFLTTPQRSRKYAIDPNVYHRLMAQLCLDTMLNGLKRDMCGFGDPAKANKEVTDLIERRQAAFDEALLYACRFWSRHLAQLPKDGVANEALVAALRKFSTTVLLCWIESLSLYDELESAIVMLREGIDWLQVGSLVVSASGLAQDIVPQTLHDIPNDVLSLLEDADRLVVLYMEAISQCALHVHVTAVLLAPTNSTIYKTFKDHSFGTLIMHPNTDDWKALRAELDLRHPIYSVVFSPDDKVIATAGADHGVQVWNTITGGNVASLGDHSSTALLVCFSPSGAFLAAAFQDGTIAVWDPKVGREHLRHESCHSEQISCIEFSKNSVLLASGARDHVIQVWSMETARALYRLATHEGPVTSLTFSSDSLWLFSGSEDNLVMIWDMSSGKLARGMMGHRKAVNCVAISEDGNTLASGSEDKSIKLWDLRSGKCIQTFSKGHYTGIRMVRFHDQDKHLVAACDEAVLSWDVASRNTSDTMWSAAKFARQLLKNIPAWKIKIFGLAAPNPILRHMFQEMSADKVDSSVVPHLKAAFASRSNSFVFTTRGYTFGGPIQSSISDMPFSSAKSITSLAVSSDGSWAVTADSHGSLQISSVTMPRKTWGDVESFAKSYPHLVTNTVVPSPTGMRFVVESLTQWALVDEKFDVIKGIEMGVVGRMRDDDDVRFKFSSDGSVFCSLVLNLFNEDKSTLHVYDAMTGERRAQFSGLKKVKSFTASTGGTWVACGHDNGQVDVFEVVNRQQTSTMKLGDSPVQRLCFSNDGQTLIGGSQNGVVCSWDRASGTCKATLEASASAVTALAYVGTGDDARVAIGRDDGSVCVWSPSRSTSHDVVQNDQATVKKVEVVRFSDDQSRLLSRGEDGTVFTWAISSDSDGTQCRLCNPTHEDQDKAKHEDQGEAEGTASAPTPNLHLHLLSRSNPGDAVDDLLHTAYRVRKDDGWLVHGERRVIWLPPSSRPSGKGSLFAYPNGLVLFFSPGQKLHFLRWIEG